MRVNHTDWSVVGASALLTASACNWLLDNNRDVSASDVGTTSEMDASCEPAGACIDDGDVPAIDAGTTLETDASCEAAGGCIDGSSAPEPRSPTGLVDAASADPIARYCAKFSMDRCDPHAACSNHGAFAKCECRGPYRGTGFTCELDEVCAQASCDRNATCDPSLDKPCKCRTNFTGDGTKCEPKFTEFCNTLTIDGEAAIEVCWNWTPNVDDYYYHGTYLVDQFPPGLIVFAVEDGVERRLVERVTTYTNVEKTFPRVCTERTPRRCVDNL